MRDKLLLCRRPIPVAVNLPNGTSFVSSYERVSRKQVPGNMSVTRTRTIGPRKKPKTKKKVRLKLANTLTRDRAKRIRKKYRNLSRRQTGKGLASSLVNLGLSMGSKAINFVIGKKIIEKGIENIPNIFKYGVSKIKNKNVQRALESDIADYVAEEAQNQTKNKLNNIFGGV